MFPSSQCPHILIPYTHMSDKGYSRTVLPNGVRLVLKPMNGINSIASAVLVSVGSRYETPAISGISHFLEHMVFKGTDKYPTTDDVNMIERVGGLQNAYTDIDVTNYHNKVLSEDWKLGLEINTQLALHPRLEQKWVDKERDVILEEMKRYDDEPASKAEETYHMMLYPNTKLGMRTIGEVESLKNTTATELRAYHDAWYVPQKMTVVLAGNTGGKEAEIASTVSQWYTPLEKKNVEDIEIVDPKQDTTQLAVVTKKDAAQAHMVLGVRTFARDSEDRYAWSLFNFIMGISFSSRLFKEVREKRGLCYHIRSGSSSYADVGSWDIYAGVATEKVEEATKAIIAELAKVRDGGITEEELVIAKKRVKTVLAFKSEDPEFWTEWYGRGDVYGMPLFSMEEYTKKLDVVNVSDVNRLVQQYITPSRMNMALVWSKPREEKLLDVLNF